MIWQHKYDSLEGKLQNSLYEILHANSLEHFHFPTIILFIFRRHNIQQYQLQLSRESISRRRWKAIHVYCHICTVRLFYSPLSFLSIPIASSKAFFASLDLSISPLLSNTLRRASRGKTLNWIFQYFSHFHIHTHLLTHAFWIKSFHAMHDWIWY